MGHTEREHRGGARHGHVRVRLLRGGNYSQSDWQDNMSLLTEQHDLESVAWELSREPFVDERNLFLCGASLGATVTLMSARANARIVKGCALLYPAFNLHDAVRAA